MASMRDIKRRKSSIQSTQQITKAMKLVSTVKLQKARSRCRTVRDPYFDCMYQTVYYPCLQDQVIWIIQYLETGCFSRRKAVIVITSNRGLAGGYNSNVVKLITGRSDCSERRRGRSMPSVDKGREVLERRGYHIVRG